MADEFYIECEYCWNEATHTRLDSLGRWFYCPNCAPRDAEVLTESNRHEPDPEELENG